MPKKKTIDVETGTGTGIATSGPEARGEAGTGPAKLRQDPHAVKPVTEKRLESAIGREVRNHRRQHNLTIGDLASATGMSLGMLSKIERGNISPSLATLQSLSQALGVPITSFFKGFEQERSAVFVKAGEGVEMERRGTRAGHQYNLLGHIGNNLSGVTVEPYLITLSKESDVFPTFQHDGLEFLYMLEGEFIYRHSETRVHMRPGDSFFFDADAPHGPDDFIKLPCIYLSIICYPQDRTER